MMYILTSLIAIIAAMITLILINGSGYEQPKADDQTLSIPIEDETDSEKDI